MLQGIRVTFLQGLRFHIGLSSMFPWVIPQPSANRVTPPYAFHPNYQGLSSQTFNVSVAKGAGREPGVSPYYQGASDAVASQGTRKRSPKRKGDTMVLLACSIVEPSSVVSSISHPDGYWIELDRV